MRLIPRRSRTRWLLAAGTTAACVAVVVTGTVSANAQEKSPAPRPAATLDRSAAPVPPPTTDPEIPDAIGEVITTGLKATGGEWVLYGVPVKEATLPDTDFGIMLGRRLADGTLDPAVMANETEGPDTAPGFHAVSGSMDIDAGSSLTFGYYAGPAATITGTVGGRKVTASQEVWSEDPSVVVFWFPPRTSVKDLAAFDAAGTRLPSGNSAVGLG